MKAKCEAFTLIELLVVIAIIGILASLLFPAAGSAINAARRVTAQNDVTQIATAMTAYETAYETEYGRGAWEPEGTFTAVENELLERLMGSNSRGIVFLEVPILKKDQKKNGYTNRQFVDPWGGVYQIKYDESYSHSLTNKPLRKFPTKNTLPLFSARPIPSCIPAAKT